MIIDLEKLPHVSSISSSAGIVEMELEDPFPELEEQKGNPLMFAVAFCDSLVIVIGTLSSYQRVEPDPDLPEQDVFARVLVTGQSIQISI